MITSEKLKELNENIKKIEVKGKLYACVPARVAAFREMCPEGSITTEILHLEDGVVTMMTTVKDEAGNILATGLAQEKEGSSQVNRTSYIENCETSAVGRALGMLGIGSDEQMASAEEVANAINQQTADNVPMMSKKQSDYIKSLCKDSEARQTYIKQQEINWPEFTAREASELIETLLGM